MKSVLSIAGSDCSGGAGIQADIKACHALDTFCFTAITAVTAQNPHGVSLIEYVGDEVLEAQLYAILQDFKPDAVKIGMMPCASAVAITAAFISEYNLKNVVIDPVLAATSGPALIGSSPTDSSQTIQALTDLLFPLATLITPNLPELKRLTGIHDAEQLRNAVAILTEKYPQTGLLVKGGHAEYSLNSIDTLYWEEEIYRFSSPRIFTSQTHGTGCTLSAAIAAEIANGKDLPEAVRLAKEIVTQAIIKADSEPFTDYNSPILL